MLNYIALHGPIGSGKTSLAKELATRGYTWINYTDELKQNLSDALARAAGVSVTTAQMNQDKEKWRPLINAWGDAIEFATRREFIDEALSGWRWLGQGAVFDNIRSIQQAIVVREYGFKVVKLLAPMEVLHERRPATEESRSHWIETPLPSKYIDYHIDASQPLEDVVRQVLSL